MNKNHPDLERLQRDNDALRQRVAELQQALAEQQEQARQKVAQMQQNQSTLQLLIDNLPAVIYAVDTEGRLIMANRIWGTSVGQQVEAALGKTPEELFGPEIGAHWSQTNQQILAAATVFEQEESFPQTDGIHTYISMRFPLRDEQGRIYGLGGISTDITERKRMEEQFRLAQFSLDRAADLVLWSPNKAVFIYANDSACNELGYSREELLSMTPLDLDSHLTPEIMPQIEQALGELGSVRLDTEWRRKDGSLLPVDVVLTRFEVGDNAYICTFARNITAQKQAEAERARMQQEIIEAQQAALRDLSTPLIPISDNVVIMPLIGNIDSRRAQMVMETLLEGVAAHQAELVIIDITGVTVVDTQVAKALVSAAQAVQLLGARVMLTGIQPGIAQTIVHLGVDLSGITTRGSLQAGIAAALGS